MCLKQRCVSSLICLFMLSWLQQVMCTISSTGQTVSYYQLRSKSHPFSLSNTCHDKNIPYVDWWSYRPVRSLGSWQVPLSQAKVAPADWCPLSSVKQPSEVMPFPADSVRAEVPPSHLMWHGAGLIPWQGVIKAAGGPQMLSHAIRLWCWLGPGSISDLSPLSDSGSVWEGWGEEKGGREAWGSVVKH